jgi:hypothetical protein
MGVVFAKTARGQEEITAKSGGLTPRQRRALIFVDGKRSVDELRDMLQSDDLQHTLGLLEEAGFIEVATPAPASVGGEAPSITAFRPLPDPANPKELEMAKNFIMNSLKTFTGPYTHLTIIEAAFAARTHKELREQFGPWYNAIVQTREGRRRAEELRGQLLQVI